MAASKPTPSKADRLRSLFAECKAIAEGDAQAAATLVLAYVNMEADPPVETPTGLLDVKQAAERLGVSVATVRGLVTCGKLPASKIGSGRGVLRFDPADLHTYQREAAGNPLSAHSRHSRRFVK